MAAGSKKVRCSGPCKGTHTSKQMVKCQACPQQQRMCLSCAVLPRKPARQSFRCQHHAENYPSWLQSEFEACLEALRECKMDLPDANHFVEFTRRIRETGEMAMVEAAHHALRRAIESQPRTVNEERMRTSLLTSMALNPNRNFLDACMFLSQAGLDALCRKISGGQLPLYYGKNCHSQQVWHFDLVAANTTRCIRVGILSSDFWQGHPTLDLISSFVKRLSSVDRFSVIVLHDDDSSCCDRTSAKDWMNSWKCQNLLFQTLRQQENRDGAFTGSWSDVVRDVRGLGLHILLELNSFTEGNTMPLVFSRVAPLQISFLGFPSVVRLRTVDLQVVDKHVLACEDISEPRFIVFPASYQANSFRELYPTVRHTHPTKAVLGCFINPERISRDTLRCFARILRRCKASLCIHIIKPEGTDLLGNLPAHFVEILKGAQATCPAGEREAMEKDINLLASRLIMVDAISDKQEHLHRVAGCRLALDAVPTAKTAGHLSHTTGSDALWSGTPIVTLEGLSFASRVLCGLLRGLGLPGLITQTYSEYENLVVGLVQNETLYCKLRLLLWIQRSRSEVFDSASWSARMQQ
eukprot:200983-Rhodomonas_salina.1